MSQKNKVTVEVLCDDMYSEKICIKSGDKTLFIEECAGGPTTDITGAIDTLRFLNKTGVIDLKFIGDKTLHNYGIHAEDLKIN